MPQNDLILLSEHFDTSGVGFLNEAKNSVLRVLWPNARKAFTIYMSVRLTG
jgi:preprotein translocase subunit SecE